MSVSLDQMIKVGPWRIMVLSECRIIANQNNGAMFASGCKQPVAVLIRHGAALSVFGPQGNSMTRAQVETLYPGVWRRALDAD